VRVAVLSLALASAFSNAPALIAQLPSVVPAPAPGSAAENADRLSQLRAASSGAGYLLRSLGTRLTAASLAGDTVLLLSPEFTFFYNSAHPWGWNDGPLRAGRGASAMVTGGIAARIGRFTLVAFPQLVGEANLDIQTFPYPQPDPPERNVWANPFYPIPTSLDYPQRFGDKARRAVHVQARAAFDASAAIRVGLSTENRWWGPAVKNALLLSSNAPGFGHFFIESPSAVKTRVGDFEYQYLLGTLRESEFFDFNGANDARTLTALGLTWRAPGEDNPWPTVGIARAVMSRGGPTTDDLLAFGRNVGRPWSRTADSAYARDQILTVFSRWLFPEQGVETYFEWARYEQFASLRDFLEHPGHAQGYTLGAQYAAPFRSGTAHLQMEFSYTEPSASIRVRPVSTSYTSTSIAQGWTHRGQMLGPAIGPAGSMQWLAGDFHAERWRAGLTLGRVRRDANYRFLNPVPPKREDVSLYATLRAGLRIGPMDALIEFTDGVRLNYLYQAFPVPNSPEGESTGIDLINRTLSLTLTPRIRTTPR
jgi:hypothetical protein